MISSSFLMKWANPDQLDQPISAATIAMIDFMAVDGCLTAD